MSSAANPEDPGAEQPFISHLIELRDRLIRMLIAVALVFLVLFPFANDIYTMMAGPIIAKLPEGAGMIATQVASPFLTPFKLALVVAVFVAMPYLLYQFWAFIAPGLYQHEKRLAIPLVASSIVLFYLGMVFAYFVVFPIIFSFFASVTPEGVTQMPDIEFYLEFILKLFFAFGIAFEIPIATILLVAIGATTPAQLRRQRPYVIVGAFVTGMLLTPPDVISQTLLAVPMWLLFELGIFLSRFLLRQRLASASGGAGDDGGPPSGTPDARHPDADLVVGRELSPGGVDEPGRFDPLSEEELEAELDALDAADRVDGGSPTAVHAKLAEIKGLRDSGDDPGRLRQLLYEVLREGDDAQRRVAENILADLDRP